MIPIPGLHNIAEVDNVARAVQERRELDAQEVGELQRASEKLMARLPVHYQWLQDWQYV